MQKVRAATTCCLVVSVCLNWPQNSRLSFPATGPQNLELIFKSREAKRIINFNTFLKGFQRVLEGVLVLKGPSADPFKNPFRDPFRDPFRNPSGVRGFCSRNEGLYSTLPSDCSRAQKATNSQRRERIRDLTQCSRNGIVAVFPYSRLIGLTDGTGTPEDTECWWRAVTVSNGNGNGVPNLQMFIFVLRFLTWMSVLSDEPP